MAMHLEMAEGEGQPDRIEAQLLQAPDNGGKVLRHAVVPLAQVAWRSQSCIEAIPVHANTQQSVSST